MKKIFKSFAAAAMAALMAAGVVTNVSAYASALESAEYVSGEETSDFGYSELDDGTLYINEYNGSGEEVVIPSEIDGKRVTKIGTALFLNNKEIKSAVISDGIPEIGGEAFGNCTNLADVSIPDSVAVIGFNAFEGTAWYDAQPDGIVYAGKVAYGYKGEMPENTSVEFKDGTKGIGDVSFNGLPNLTSVKIPDSVINIGGYAFTGCGNLKSIIGANGIKTIGTFAFDNCTALENINLPKGLTSIGDNAFSKCESLKSITIPEGVTKIGKSVFYACTGIEKLTLPETLTEIDAWAFSGCTSLESVKISGNVRVVAYQAFYDCQNLTSVILPDGLEEIGITAFYGCEKLKNLSVPASVTKIDFRALGYTFGNSLVSDFTITGYSATAAQTYANENGIAFKEIPAGEPILITLSTVSRTLGVGETNTLTAQPSPADSATTLIWSSSDVSVAAVDGNGKVSAKKVGTTTITAKTKYGISASCKITVKKAPTSITLNATELTLEIGETFDLNSSFPSGEGSYAIYYSSDNPSVASVKKSGGLVTAVAPGTAIITATTYNNKTVTCKVTVNEPEPELILGDVNSDGNVNLRDAIEIQKCVLSMISFDENQCKCGDVDKSGSIKLLDSIYVQKYCLRMDIEISGIGKPISIIDPETGKVLYYNEAVYEYTEVWVVDKAAYTYEEPVYETIGVSICNACGADITGNPSPHLKQHALNDENASYHSEYKKVQTGTKTVTVPEQGHYETQKKLVREAGYY
ncbi:MAG: leucine-rich repeat protein [Acutalibacteraceae bacterium]